MKLKKRSVSLLITLFVASFVLLIRPYLPEDLRNSIFPVTPTPSTSLRAIDRVQSPIRVDTVKVKRVVDGDTVELETGESLRYIGIDTPETKHPKKTIQCFGKEAYEENKKLVEGKTIKIVKDVSNVDRYNRLLRYVYVATPSSPSGILVNDYLVRNGFAFTTTFPPDVAMAEQFRLAEREARKNNLGMWKACSTI